MLVAYDKEGNRLYANAGVRYRDCYCKVCGESIAHKIPTQKRPYFSHKPNTMCDYGKDKDNKSEWHIRMQEYFPKESLEYYFYDEIKNEIHIADVFLKEANVVIEFQHTPISQDEFISRSAFHINNGRRLVWVFDESSNSEKNTYGRFKADDCGWENRLYADRCFKWLYHPRNFLKDGPKIDYERVVPLYSICVYTGTEGDVLHRIVREYCDFSYVTFSLHDIEMRPGLNIDEFFLPESHWNPDDPAMLALQAIAIKKQMEALNVEKNACNGLNRIGSRQIKRTKRSRFR